MLRDKIDGLQVGFEEFLYKQNVSVLGEMLSKISKTCIFVLAITHPN